MSKRGRFRVETTFMPSGGEASAFSIQFISDLDIRISRSVANGAEERKPSGPFTCSENEDSSWTREELRSEFDEGRC